MNQLSRHLENFAGRHVLVAGDLMLDEYLWGHIDRISPEAPVPVFRHMSQEDNLGGAGNVARNLLTLGARVSAVGVVGQDAAGQRILALLDSLGAERDGVLEDPERKSTRKTRLMSLEHGQQVFRIDEESVEPVHGEAENRLMELLRAKTGQAQAVLCSDYQKGLLTPRVLEAAFESARSHRVPAIVAPKDSSVEKYRGASVLMPNLRELAQLTGAQAEGDRWIGDAAPRLVEILGLEALVVTRGREGMCLFERRVRRGTQPGPRGGLGHALSAAAIPITEGRRGTLQRAPTQQSVGGVRRVDIPTVARSVYDVTGAGDTAIAAFGLAVAAGADWESAARLANVAAGIVVAKRGTGAVTVVEIRARLDDASENPDRP